MRHHPEISHLSIPLLVWDAVWFVVSGEKSGGGWGSGLWSVTRVASPVAPKCTGNATASARSAATEGSQREKLCFPIQITVRDTVRE